MTSFESGEQLWIERLGSLRNVVRQEVVARQIAPLAVRGASVLDVGCGQGTQALRLALVCCHGVMMYLDDWAQAIADMGERVKTGGRASITFRNGDALAMRPGLRGDWAAALAALESTDYTNELGLPAHACTAAEIDVALASAGLRPDAWPEQARPRLRDAGQTTIRRSRRAAICPALKPSSCITSSLPVRRYRVNSRQPAIGPPPSAKPRETPKKSLGDKWPSFKKLKELALGKA